MVDFEQENVSWEGTRNIAPNVLNVLKVAEADLSPLQHPRWSSL